MPVVLRTVSQVRQWRHALRRAEKLVGFVPTMGALHHGHLSLVHQSQVENDATVVLIFVNPSQFGPNEDLDAYPRTLDDDLAQLEAANVEAVFVPKVSEMYPSGITLEVSEQRGAFVEVKGCSHQLEGVTRPQFFRGVATVVCKLLNVVQPTRVYFGQKDAQQCVVIRNMVKDLLIDTEVRVLPTQREPLGLALLLRNAYLSQSTKDELKAIFQALTKGQQLWNSDQSVSGSQIVDLVKQQLTELGLKVEYVACSHPETLDDITDNVVAGSIVSTAVHVPRAKGNGTARLIDNVILQ